MTVPGAIFIGSVAEVAAYVERLGEQFRRDAERKLITELLLAGVAEEEIDAAVQLLNDDFAKCIAKTYAALAAAQERART